MPNWRMLGSVTGACGCSLVPAVVAALSLAWTRASPACSSRGSVACPCAMRNLRFAAALVLVALLVAAAGAAGSEVHAAGSFLGLGHERGAGRVLSQVDDTGDVTGPVDSASHLTLQASPDVVEDGGKVTLSWSGGKDTSLEDFIAVFCLYDGEAMPKTVSGPMDMHTLDGIVFTEWNLTQISGNITLDTEFIDMGCDYVFALYRGPGSPLAVSNKVRVLNVGLRHGRLALTGFPGQVQVSWTTRSKNYKPQVQYGTSPGQYSVLEEGFDNALGTYTADLLCDAPANIVAQRWFRHPGYFRTLHPGARYFYRFGNDKQGWSKEYSFKAPPLVGPTEAVTFIGYGDMGISYFVNADDQEKPPLFEWGDARSTAKAVAAESSRADFVLHYGDLAYALGAEYVWERFMRQIEPIAASTPYMVSMGNHEYDHSSGGERDPSGAALPGGFRPEWGNYGDDSGGECAVPTLARFRPPANGFKLFWYSFDYGNVHVVQLSTEHDFMEGSAQLRWLKADLRAVKRTKTPWVVVTSHRPMYCSQVRPPNNTVEWQIADHMRESIEPLLYKYQVDLWLAGHYHSYQRTCVVHQQQCVAAAEGTVHVTVGTAGAFRYQTPFVDTVWSINQDFMHYGYVRVTAEPDIMHVAYISSETGETIDETFIVRKPASSIAPSGQAVVVLITVALAVAVLVTIVASILVERMRRRRDAAYVAVARDESSPSSAGSPEQASSLENGEMSGGEITLEPELGRTAVHAPIDIAHRQFS
eukprot:jgi/Chlat1/1659/Chrsp127S01953